MVRHIPSLAFSLALVAFAAPHAGAADRAAVARSACINMGLNTSEAPFTGCVTSLTQSMSALDGGGLSAGRGDRVAGVGVGRAEVVHAVPETREGRACAEIGLASGTRQYQSCVGNLQAAMFEYSNIGAR